MPITKQDLGARLGVTALAFRGYNLTNLGRTAELLAHARYGPVVEDYLRRASATCQEISGRPIDLVARVRRGEEATLETYDEAVSLIVAMEAAQMHLLRDLFQVKYEMAALAFGYSLGEIAALVCGEVLTMEDALKIPLSLVPDCVELARGVSLGILFSRGTLLPLHNVTRLCLHINNEGAGVIGISAYLSPNSVLLLGQGDTLERFKQRMRTEVDASVHLRIHGEHWPPLHTPILWERCIPNRAARMMHNLPGGFTAPRPPIFSLVTGKISYNDYNAREIIHHWVDHPQRLWDAIYHTLEHGVERIIHVGPEPNIIPATYRRLADNVELQTRGRRGLKTLQSVVPHPWLRRLLPNQAALLRAPLIKHIILEDWLLEQQF